MDVGTGLSMYDVVVKKFTFGISSDEFLFYIYFRNTFMSHDYSASEYIFYFAR